MSFSTIMIYLNFTVGEGNVPQWNLISKFQYLKLLIFIISCYFLLAFFVKWELDIRIVDKYPLDLERKMNIQKT